MTTRHLKMTLKLLIFFLTTCVFIAQASNQQQDDTEAFITKEAAKELRNKLSSSNSEVAAADEQQDDYDEILRGIIRGLRQKPKQQIYIEKKYFDYLPNEIPTDGEDSSFDNEDLSAELEKPASDVMSEDNEETAVAKKRRSKRDVAAAFESRSSSSFVNKNPWNPQNNPNLRLHPPGNFYLPPPPSRPPPTYLPPTNTNNRRPVNVPQPPHNKVDEYGNRVGGFEGEDDPFIFDFRPMTNQGGFGGGGSGGKGNWNNGGGSGNKREPPPVIHSQSMHGSYPSNEDVDIEYAPEIQEDVSTTTRASIKKPTRKNQNKSQQQPNSRQRKSEESMTSTTTERANTWQQDFMATSSLNNDKPNKPLSSCVEAIVNCCSRYDEEVRVPCFEAHNCNGAFFGPSPCRSETRQAALREVEKYSEANRR